MDVHITERIASGAAHVRPILLAQLAHYHDAPQDEPPVLDAAGIQVPISMRIGKRIGNPPDGAEVTIQAKRHRERFPVFTGTIRILSLDTLSSELVLSGHYDVPLGLLGALADRTVLASTAESSLQRLLARMKDELSTAVLNSIMGNPTR